MQLAKSNVVIRKFHECLELQIMLIERKNSIRNAFHVFMNSIGVSN